MRNTILQKTILAWAGGGEGLSSSRREKQGALVPVGCLSEPCFSVVAWTNQGLPLSGLRLGLFSVFQEGQLSVRPVFVSAVCQLSSATCL